jgi:hypothetical protein
MTRQAPNAAGVLREPPRRKLRAWPVPGTAAGIGSFSLVDTLGIKRRDSPRVFLAPYHFLGPCQYVSHNGSRQINITWRLKHPVPAGLYRSMPRQIAV